MYKLGLQQWICDACKKFRKTVLELKCDQRMQIIRLRVAYAGGQLMIVGVLANDSFHGILNRVQGVGVE